MNTKQFVERAGIRMSVKPASKPNPFMPMASTHWDVKLTCSTTGKEMKVAFSQGSAHREPPSLATVLECLASDSAMVENGERPDIDGDAWRAAIRQSTKLRSLLGDEQYDTLLWDVDTDEEL